MQSDAEIAKIIGAELEAALALAVSADNGRMQLAIDYSEGRLPANDDPNGDVDREAVSLDVADMVEAVYAQMAPALEDAGGIQFDAMGADDEPQAQQESAIVRAMLMEGYAAEGGFVSLSECIKDALLLRTGVLALYVDRTETREPEEWEAVPELAVGDVLKPTQPGQRVESVNIERDEEAQKAAVAEAQEAAPGAFYRVTLDRVSVDKRLCLHSVPRENFLSSSMQHRDPNRMRFCADRMVVSRSQLVAEGFDKGEVAKLKRHDPTTYDLWIRRSDGAELDVHPAAQDATETVEVWRCYALLADTADGVEAARYRVYYSHDGRCLVGKPERVGRVCYAIANTILYPHRLDGVSLFDRVGEVQEIKTKAIRAWVENAHKVNRPRLGVVESQCNLADAMDATQDVIRLKSATPGVLQPVPVIDAGPSLSALMAFMDQARSERGGASLDMQSAQAQIATNQTAQGIERQYSVKEQLAAMMARTFGETGLRSAFQIAHYLLRTAWGDQLTVKVNGEWQTVDPSKWRPRHGVRIRIGQSESQRTKKVVSLQQIMAMQVSAMQQGMDGVMVDATRIYNAACDLVMASQLSNPERYLIDPASPQAQQAAKQKAQQAQASQQAQAAGMRAAMMIDKYKTDIKGYTDFVKVLADLAIEEAKLMVTPEPIDQAQEVAGEGAAASAGQAAQSLQAGAPQPPHPQAGELPSLATEGTP